MCLLKERRFNIFFDEKSFKNYPLPVPVENKLEEFRCKLRHGKGDIVLDVSLLCELDIEMVKYVIGYSAIDEYENGRRYLKFCEVR